MATNPLKISDSDPTEPTRAYLQREPLYGAKQPPRHGGSLMQGSRRTRPGLLQEPRSKRGWEMWTPSGAGGLCVPFGCVCWVVRVPLQRGQCWSVAMLAST